MRIGLLQHDIEWEDRDATLARLTPSVDRAAAAGVELLVLTEMFATGFSMRPERTAEPESGPIVSWMTERAREHGMRLVGSLALDSEDGGLPSNRLVIVGPDGVEHRYDKLHPFSRSGEHEHFRAGDAPVVADVDGIRFGLTVCYDLRFANLYWDLGPRVDAFIVVANWPAARRDAWTTLLRARAIEGQAYVLGVNRVGRGGDVDYVGDSQVIGPRGEIEVSASEVETLLLADLDPDRIAAGRESFPTFADRRDL